VKVEIKDISQVQKEMVITIEVEQAAKDYNMILNKVKKHVSLPGFRKGKTPLALIERNYADYIKEEFYNQKIGEYYKEALDQVDVNPINKGEAVNIEWEKGKELVATFRFEVMAEVKVEKYLDLEVPYEKMKFKKSMVDETVETFRQKMASELDKEIVEQDNKLGLTLNFLSDTGEITKHIDREIVQGKNQYSKSFNSKLVGMKVNDEIKSKLFTANQKVEDSDITEDLKGKDFLVKVNSIKKVELPELNEDFAKDLEYESLEKMLAQIETDLKARLENENKSRLKEAITAKLVEVNPLEVPDSMVTSYAESMAKPYAESYKMDLEQIIPFYKQMAEFNMKSHYIMEELINKEKIEITESDIEEMTAEAALNMKMDIDKYKEMYKKQIDSEDFKRAIKEKKIIELIEKSCKFVPYPKEDKKAEKTAE